MEPHDQAPPLAARVEVVVGNVIPVFGVIFLGWSAFQVVSLYVLDGWFCILGLGASVMIQGREELSAMVPSKYGQVRRFLFWVVTIGVVEAILSMFAVIPGFMVLAHMEDSPFLALGNAFGGARGWVPVAMLVVSHVMRIARGSRGEGDGVMALDPKAQMSLYAGRMALMMWLAWLAAAGALSRILVPVYVTCVAALFTYTDLYPRRFLERVMRSRQSSTDPDGDESTANHRSTRPKLPR